MSSKGNPDVPAGYLLEEITAGENGVVTLWRSPDGKDHVWTFDGPIREKLERIARRHGLTCDAVARTLGLPGSTGWPVDRCGADLMAGASVPSLCARRVPITGPSSRASG